MTDTPTPGQGAYVAYVQVRYGMPPAEAALSYTRSIPQEQAAWDAAAQAVLALACPTPEPVAVTQAVTAGHALLTEEDTP